MSAVDQLLQGSSNSLSGYTFMDADTLRDPNDPNVTYRLQGYDAPEITKFKESGEQLGAGTAGGSTVTPAIRDLAQSQGFTNIVKTGRFDPNGREIIELHDAEGRNFTTMLMQAGVQEPGKYVTNEDLDAVAVGRLMRSREGYEETDWDRAAADINAGITAEQYRDTAFRQQALNEFEYAMAPHLYTQAVQFRHTDRDITNKSNSPFSDSWERGWIGVKEAAFGTLELLGDTTGADRLKDIGEAGITRARSHMSDYGTALVDYKDVDSFGTAMEFLGNNLALSLPYMAITVGGSVAAPITGGLSLAAPAAIYTGQTWNEMEGEKNAAVAIGSGIMQATLDRLGLAGVIGVAGKAPKQLWNEATEELIKRGFTPKQAAAQLASTSRKEIAGLVGDAAEVAKRQIQAKVIFNEMAKKGLAGAATEGVTEGLQEATGYLGAVYGSDKTFDFEELNERIMAGVVAGSALGGAFTVPGSLYEAGAWADVAVRQAPADAARLSEAGKHAEFEREQFGRVKSIEENTAEARAAAAARPANEAATMQERTYQDKRRRKDRTFTETLFDTVAATPSLWRGATRFIFTPELQAQSRAARVLADMFGGNLQRTFSGANYESAKHHRVSIYKNMVDMPDQFYSNWTGGRQVSRKQKEQISREVYAQLNGAVNEDGVFDPNLVPEGPHKQHIIALQKQLQALSDKMYADQKKAGGELGKLQNYLMRYKSFNKGAIYRNKNKFTKLLMQEFNMSEKDAKDITDSITDSLEINDIADALTAAGAAGKPGSHKARTLNLAEKDAFQEFMNQDIFSNINDAARSAARFTAYQDYVGQNESVIAELLQQMEEDGVSQDEVNRVAAQMRDYLDAESGNYKRPKSDFWKKAQTVQRNFMMITTIAGLPLATISSFVEAALTMKGLTLDQIMGRDGKGGLAALGHELGHTLWTGAQEVANIAGDRQVMPAATRGKEMLQNLGFYDWDVGAATTTGVTETNPWQQHIYEQFFKWTGLQGWTNYTRAVRASIAGDYIVNKLDTILNEDGTNAALEATEQLRALGINVDDMLDAYRGDGMFDPQKYDIIETNFREGTFNFINEAVALPQSANRPLLYQDPRFALFTQFQGFIATFTANHIPKLWGEYVKRGTPAMKYNAFAVMTSMIMLGFASQYLKDMIKHGKPLTFGPEAHPFLDPAEYLQRGVRASGLLGTGERVLDQFFPLYDQRSEGITEWAFNGITGESPALGYGVKAGSAVGNILTGDVGRGAKDASRFLPLLGTLNFFRSGVEEQASKWNFNGE